MRAIVGLITKSIILILIGIFIYEIPYLYHELRFVVRPFKSYQIKDRENSILDTGSARIISPENTQFGLIVPKLGINVAVHEDGFEYEDGVYHFPASSKPGSRAEVVMKTFYSEGELINRKNSIYPLLHRLIPGDEVIVYYNDKKHTYYVKEIKIVPTEVYAGGIDREYSNSLRIDVNWPPGLYFQKLLIYTSLNE